MARVVAAMAILFLGLQCACSAVLPAMTCDSWIDVALCTKLPTGGTALTVNQFGGGAMQNTPNYITGQFSLDLKLQAGNTGGTAVAWYVQDGVTATNKDLKRSEIDFQFLGNLTANTITLSTNVYNGGKQNLAQFRLPFDPSAAFHNYAIRWNSQQIVWLVDGQPLRVLNRVAGEPWPTLAMRPQASIWATPWSALQANFAKGPIRVWAQNYRATGCLAAMTAAQTKPVQCVGPWNAPLTLGQLAAFKKLRAQSLIVEYGWDAA